jgi:hypothetical protein
MQSHGSGHAGVICWSGADAPARSRAPDPALVAAGDTPQATRQHTTANTTPTSFLRMIGTPLLPKHVRPVARPDKQIVLWRCTRGMRFSAFSGSAAL